MTPPERFPPDDPREWIRRARGNLDQATTVEHLAEDRCTAAQQTAEKAIKAVCIAHRLSFPFVHDLDRLLRLLQEAGVEIPHSVFLARRLTPYASVVRYPGDYLPVTEQECAEAVSIARDVLRWAREQT